MTQLQSVESELLTAFRDLRPVAQIYIADGDIDTRICIQNYFSALAPEIEEGVQGQFLFFDGSGSILARKEFDLAYNGSLSLPVTQTLQEASIVSPLGMVGCLLFPKDLEKFRPYLDHTYAHFFAYYHDQKNENSAMIHPQIRLGDEADGEDWRSSQSIHVGGLEGLTIYHPNPSAETRCPTYELRDLSSGEVIASRTITMPSLGAAKTMFTAGELHCPSGYLYLRVHPLPAPNGKPLLMRRFANGRFSMSHG